jgi:hypothetical protein
VQELKERDSTAHCECEQSASHIQKVSAQLERVKPHRKPFSIINKASRASQSAVAFQHVAAFCLPRNAIRRRRQAERSRLSEIALVLMSLDHVPGGIVNANHNVM